MLLPAIVVKFVWLKIYLTEMALVPSFLERIFKSLIAYESPDPYVTLTHALYPSYHSFCMSVLNKNNDFHQE